MDALAHWRQATLRERNAGYSLSPSPLEDQPESVPSSTPASPPISASPSPPPTPDTEEDKPNQNQMHARSKSEPPEQQKKQEDDRQVGMNAGKKPTSLSWVQWWSRSRRKESEAAKDGRPGLTTSPVPLHSVSVVFTSVDSLSLSLRRKDCQNQSL
jgi:phosphatidate phosphatase LPIN